MLIWSINIFTEFALLSVQFGSSVVAVAASNWCKLLHTYLFTIVANLLSLLDHEPTVNGVKAELL